MARASSVMIKTRSPSWMPMHSAALRAPRRNRSGVTSTPVPFESVIVNLLPSTACTLSDRRGAGTGYQGEWPPFPGATTSAACFLTAEIGML